MRSGVCVPRLAIVALAATSTDWSVGSWHTVHKCSTYMYLSQAEP